MPSSPNSTTVSSTNNHGPVYRIVDIIEGTSVDGPGLRTSIYFAGCDHRCAGCHNPGTWSHDAGRDYTLAELTEIIREARFNVTLTGGDPVYQAHSLKPLIEAIRAMGLTVWLYTGFTYEELLDMPEVKDFLTLIETVVDGPFILERRTTELPFRGSDNQRLISPL